MEPSLATQILSLLSAVEEITDHLNATESSATDNTSDTSQDLHSEDLTLLARTQEVSAAVSLALTNMPSASLLSLYSQTLAAANRRTIQIRSSFHELNTLLISLSRNYKVTRSPILLSDIRLIHPLANHSFLFHFPSHLIGLTDTEATDIADISNRHVKTINNTQTAHVTANQILRLKQGMLISGRDLPFVFTTDLQINVGHLLTADMSDAEVAELVDGKLKTLAEDLVAVRTGDGVELRRISPSAFVGLGEGECFNGFTTILAENVEVCYRDLLVEATKELCDICGCVGCAQELQSTGVNE